MTISRAKIGAIGLTSAIAGIAVTAAASRPDWPEARRMAQASASPFDERYAEAAATRLFVADGAASKNHAGSRERR